MLINVCWCATLRNFLCSSLLSISYLLLLNLDLPCSFVDHHTCLQVLKQAKGIVATYRMTNRPLPSRHSPYVTSILQPLKVNSSYSYLMMITIIMITMTVRFTYKKRLLSLVSFMCVLAIDLIFISCPIFFPRKTFPVLSLSS